MLNEPLVYNTSLNYFNILNIKRTQNTVSDLHITHIVSFAVPLCSLRRVGLRFIPF